MTTTTVNNWQNTINTPVSPQEHNDIVQLRMYVQEFGISFDKISSLLHETGSIICGSLPLQAVLKERWPNSDMDIYAPSQIGDKINQLTELFVTNGYKVESIMKPDLIANNKRLRGTIDVVHSYVHTDPTKQLSLQIVVCNDLPFVLNSVDLSCTTLQFNGTRLIGLENIDDIRNKVAFMRNPIELTVKEELTERIKKYTERGFTIYDYSRSKIVDDRTFA